MSSFTHYTYGHGYFTPVLTFFIVTIKPYRSISFTCHNSPCVYTKCPWCLRRCPRSSLMPMFCFKLFPYRWLAGQYGECSVSCGEGVQTRELRCARIENGRMQEVNENKCDQDSRPPRDTPCERGVCPAPAEWVKSAWSEVCSYVNRIGVSSQEIK